MYDIIVIGAGHAGIEAALAASRMGKKTLLLALSREGIGLMSCNPAIGGVGKGQLVKEIDALGGQMARAADACGIQFRMLNASKGPAVQSSRAQIDMQLYKDYMRGIVEAQENLDFLEDEAVSLIVKGNTAAGVVTAKSGEIGALAVVICPGTFLAGLIHVGLRHFSAGRINEPASDKLAADLKELGFNLLRFKTGTCPRLDARTIDYSGMITQCGDDPALPFSFSTDKIPQKQVPCHITYTNKDTHRIILDNLDRSPLYAGIISATGVRYCPSIEDKIVKFRDRDRHQIFLEPQGLNTTEIYPNGLSTSLPEDVQLEILHSIDGLKKVEVVRFGYGIEHTVVEPTQLYPTLETKTISNLYLAGQINGTTGYEEAAAQGLVAGINAALRAGNKEPCVLDRSTSYIGVLIDDLTAKGTLEPYRMFTSRVEYRLILRQDNADLRLSEIGRELGLVGESDFRRVKKKEEAIKKGMGLLRSRIIKPAAAINKYLEAQGTSVLKRPLKAEDILKRPQVALDTLKGIEGVGLDIPDFAMKQVEIEVKYSGFIERQFQEVARFKNLEKIRIPHALDYSVIAGLSREIKEKLGRVRPVSLGQASRISGVTPAAVSLLMVYLKKING